MEAVAAAITATAMILVALLQVHRRNKADHAVTDEKLDAIGIVATDARDTSHRVEGKVEQIDGRVTRLEQTGDAMRSGPRTTGI